MTAYATKAQLVALLGLPAGDTTLDPVADDLLEQASRYLDDHCGRDFFRYPAIGSQPDSEVRLFDGDGLMDLLIPEGLVRVDLVEIAPFTGQAFSTLPSSDYFTLPVRALTGWPYDGLQLSEVPTLTSVWYRGQRNVRITGVFGWDGVPTAIERATLDLARELYRQGPGGGGPVGVNQFGTPIFAGGIPKTVSEAIKTYAGSWGTVI